jgi:hypothetical protein
VNPCFNCTGERYHGHRRASSVSTLVHAGDSATQTPIKHAIIIIGENRTFDHIFATYKPVNKGEKVLNLLSQGIVKANGNPGRNYGDALQYQAFAYSNKGYQVAPPKSPYTTLPPALAGGGAGSMGSPVVCVDIDSSFTGTECVTPPNLVIARQFENGLADDYYQYLLTGGTGQPGGQPDKRITYNGQDASNLPSGPYQLTSNTLCGEPGAPLLPDVSAARLLCRRIQRAQWLGLPVRSVSLGGSNGRRRFKRSGSANWLQRRRLDLYGLLQCPARGCALFEGTRRYLFHER